MGRKATVLFTLASLAFLVLPSVTFSQVPTVRMKGETARERFSMMREGLTPGGSQESLPVPDKQRLVITDLIISANAKACNIMVTRYPASDWSASCFGFGSDQLTPRMCVPSTGGTVSHTFATGLVIPEGWRVCIVREIDANPGVAEVLVRGYFTKAKK